MLLNSRELSTYDVRAIDGYVGKVSDFLVDDRTWHIRHLVVDTGGLLSTHKVLLTPADIIDVTHPEDVIETSRTKAQIQTADPASTAPPISAQRNASSTEGIAHDPHLRSSDAIGGYSVTATDAPLGQVHGVIIDTKKWIVRYFVVDTGEMLTAAYVLVSPEAITEIYWRKKLIKLSIAIETVRQCPEYDTEKALSRQYEGFLHDYYGWPPYWV